MTIKRTITIKKGIIKSYFVSECERQLVGDISKEQINVENQSTELAAAGSSLEQLFKQKLLQNNLFIQAPKEHFDDGE